MAERLTFTLAGRDELSRVLNNTADASDRLRLRMAGITGDADGRLRDLQGQFLSTADAQRRLDDGTGQVRARFDEMSKAAGKLGEQLKANLISLAPAAIPASAALAGAAAQLASQFGAVAVSAAAYGLALKPQITAISAATQAQTKYQDAVRLYGATSKQALKAQADYKTQLDQMPPATQRAAVAVGLLQTNFKTWSDSLAGDVMQPFNKGVAVANALLPKTTGLVKGASTQFDRLVTELGGAISTPGFDKMTGKFTDFADKTLDHAVDELNIFLAKLDAGEIGGGVKEFLDYARANGPAVWETLQNLGDALLNVLQAGSDVGVGMLDVVNVLSDIVAAVPPDAIATILQLAIAIKAVRLAAVGIEAAKTAMLALSTQIAAVNTAATATPGRLAGARAGINALSRSAKLAAAGTGLGLLLIALSSLSDVGRHAAPDVDKLALSLRNLADTGKFTGELHKTFGDMDGLIDKVKKLQTETEKANNTAFGFRIPGLDDAADWISGKINDIAKGDESLKSLKGDFDSLDKGLASLVSNGYGDQAATSFNDISKAMREAGYDTKTINGLFGDYREAVAGQALENKLAAASMGLFGEQAQTVQAQLDAQKQSADGLRQSIQALNDVNRSALDGQIGFEAAIDAASKAAKENAGVLDMQGGKLVTNTDKQRAAAQALSDLAGKTDSATASARESGASWSEVSSIYERGRAAFIKSAEAMGLTRAQAKQLADQILKTPNKTAYLKGNLQDLQAKLEAAKRRLRSVPDARRAQVRADISDLERKIRIAKDALNNLDGYSATTWIYTNYSTPHHMAGGGMVGRFADGGNVAPHDYAPFGGAVAGPGTSTSDSIPAWLSNGEYVIQASAVDKYGIGLFDALNAQRFAGGGYAAGGITYAPATAQISLSTVASSYDQDMQRLKEAWTKLNEALREQAKHSTAATRHAVAQARQAVNEADRALGLKAGSKAPSGFSLTGYGKNLEDAVKKSAAWERDLNKIGRRAGADIESTLRNMGESGQALVASLAKATGKQFKEIVANLRKLAPTAAATLSDFTRQLNTTTAGSKKFQDNLLKLAASGYGDLAMQLAGQGDETAMAVAAAAVKSPAAAKKANAAIKASGKLLSGEELTAAAQLMGVLSGKKNATIADVVKAGVSWPMLVDIAPRYGKEIRAIPGSGVFVSQMRERGIALAGGGLLQGPGTSTSDSIMLWGSRGEYMVRAAAVAKYGLKFMDAVNEGRLPVGRAAARPGLPAVATQAASAVAGGDRPAVTYQVYPRKSVIDVQDLQLLQRQEEARQRVGRPR